MATKFKTNEARIINAAIDAVFTRRVEDIPEVELEATLSGFAMALFAIGSNVVRTSEVSS